MDLQNELKLVMDALVVNDWDRVLIRVDNLEKDWEIVKYEDRMLYDVDILDIIELIVKQDVIEVQRDDSLEVACEIVNELDSDLYKED